MLAWHTRTRRAVALAALLLAPRLARPTLTVTGTRDVSAAVGAPDSSVIGDQEPSVVRFSDGTVGMVFLRFGGSLHSSPPHTVFAGHVAVDATYTPVGRFDESTGVLTMTLALGAEGTDAYILTAGTSQTAVTGWQVNAARLRGSFATVTTLIPSATLPGFGNTTALRGLVTAQAVSRRATGVVDLSFGFSKVDSTSFQPTGTFSAIVTFDPAVPGIPAASFQPNQSASAVRVGGVATATATQPLSVFADFMPGLAVHGSGGFVGMFTTTSTALPAVAPLGGSGYLIVLGAESAGAIGMQCLLDTTPSSLVRASPCPTPLFVVDDIAASADLSSPSLMWIAATSAASGEVFVARAGVFETGITLIPPFDATSCSHPSVTALDDAHAVVVAACSNRTGTASPSRVVAWTVSNVTPLVDAGVDASNDVTTTVDVIAVDGTVTDDGESDASQQDGDRTDGTSSVDAGDADVSPSQTDGSAMDTTSSGGDGMVVPQNPSVSFRGSGCACSSLPAAQTPARGLAAMLVAIAFGLQRIAHRRRVARASLPRRG